MTTRAYSYTHLTSQLPSMTDLPTSQMVRDAIIGCTDVTIVLDDDPTGTQTVRGVPVLTEWTQDVLTQEILSGTPLFYILTNTRSLAKNEAEVLNLEVLSRISQVTSMLNKRCTIISRSDSTLRGHYPMEANVIIETLKPTKPVQFIIPAFFEGGRYTIDDVHYVREGEDMIPAHLTPFAKDKVFGFASSNLIEWVQEKHRGGALGNVHSLSIEQIRTETTEGIIHDIQSFDTGDICVVNAVNYDDLFKSIYCIMKSGVSPVFRTAASAIVAFTQDIPAVIDQIPRHGNSHGGVVVLGSYVPKSTDQLYHVLENTEIEHIEIDVSSLLSGTTASPQEIANQVDELIDKGHDVIIYTSRKLISTEVKDNNLNIGAQVSSYLTGIVSSLSIEPSFIIGKGGITSSDIATKSLRIQRALVLGQIIPGVPVWEQQAESKFPGIPYIVFPGNVGSEASLTEVIKKLSHENIN